MTDKKPTVADVRPQFLVYENDDSEEQALVTEYVSSVLMIPLNEDKTRYAVGLTAGNMAVQCGDMTKEQAKVCSKHIRYAMCLPESVKLSGSGEEFSGRGRSMPVHKVIEDIKERMPESMIKLADDLH